MPCLSICYDTEDRCKHVDRSPHHKEHANGTGTRVVQIVASVAVEIEDDGEECKPFQQQDDEETNKRFGTV
jgi:hypothetical protein